ncbi:hypothetical protein, partial [Nocardia gipuzkoensis]|uniref:hypothetical protein n=1 Tax=Nocardia gipuzkoensis TaxID=2749991 RepID=UPI00237ED13F
MGGHTVRGYGRFTDRPAPRPRRRSIYFHGHRSGSADPILLVGALVLGGVVFLLVVLTVTHAHAPSRPSDTTSVQHGVPVVIAEKTTDMRKPLVASWFRARDARLGW